MGWLPGHADTPRRAKPRPRGPFPQASRDEAPRPIRRLALAAAGQEAKALDTLLALAPQQPPNQPNVGRGGLRAIVRTSRNAHQKLAATRQRAADAARGCAGIDQAARTPCRAGTRDDRASRRSTPPAVDSVAASFRAKMSKSWHSPSRNSPLDSPDCLDQLENHVGGDVAQRQKEPLVQRRFGFHAA